jgi:protein-tyrosine phosphatase
MRILFVCMGNICRSPTAEGVMRSLLDEAGLAGAVEVESAGTGGWHAGEPPDHRATEAAARRGVTLEGAARQVRATDFRDFDLLLAMDARNLRELQQMAPDAEARAKARLLREFDPASAGAPDVGTPGDHGGGAPDLDVPDPYYGGGAPDLDVPDPYYGGERGFEIVLDQVEAACRGLLRELRAGDRV